jgi:hypothetical protein
MRKCTMQVAKLVMQQHTLHDDQLVEIGKLTLDNQCKKRAAISPLRVHEYMHVITVITTTELTFSMLSATVLNAHVLPPLNAVEMVSDLSDNEAGDEDDGTSVAETATGRLEGQVGKSEVTGDRIVNSNGNGKLLVCSAATATNASGTVCVYCTLLQNVNPWCHADIPKCVARVLTLSLTMCSQSAHTIFESGQ